MLWYILTTMHPRSQAGDDRPILTRQKVLRLVGDGPPNHFDPSEEQLHPWSVEKSHRLDFPLLRIWDYNSGSQPDEDNCMLSRSPDRLLRTRKARRDSLATHLNHGIWEPSPYISFTKSACAIEELVKSREKRRSAKNQQLIVIDPATRLRSGLPILDVAAEMDYYGIPDP